ncbi:MAG: hypothetical protein HY669_01455 [Chloroflexi bacterium]|nr:hypothetical protein [Chloroflexota bacterium]
MATRAAGSVISFETRELQPTTAVVASPATADIRLLHAFLAINSKSGLRGGRFP